MSTDHCLPPSLVTERLDSVERILRSTLELLDVAQDSLRADAPEAADNLHQAMIHLEDAWGILAMHRTGRIPLRCKPPKPAGCTRPGPAGPRRA